MKKLFLPVFIILSVSVFSQPYNNSWIDYNKTYYKFKLATAGLYRIPQSALASIGLANTPAEHFQLWRNGEQVRIYTSVPSGNLGTSGYLEFWGMMNDGKKDTRLYRDPDYQLSDHWSLETDTAAYFLTVNPAGNNLRFNDVPNNVAGTLLPPESYFMNTAGTYFKNQINSGYARPVGFYVYSSSYDIGEGYTTKDIFPSAAFQASFSNLNLDPAGPPATFRFAAAGNAPNARRVRVKFLNNIISNDTMPEFSYLKKEVSNISLSNFQNTSSLNVTIEDLSTVTTDRMVVSFVEVKYPSKFNFNNLKNFYFELPATATGNFLVIDNFNYGTTAPVLLDMNSGRRYTTDISIPGKVRVVLPSSFDTLRKFVLVSKDASNIKPVDALMQRNFINVTNGSNQGNYIIISNSILFNNGSGLNNVDAYKVYRSSAAGGSFNAKVYDIDELTDQFGYGIKKHPLAIKDFIQFAKNNFVDTPRYILIIGRGVTYNEYAGHQTDPLADKLNLVQTFGYPASDILLASNYNSIIPAVAIGRLSVVNGNEVGNYLEKIKQFDAAQASSSQTIADKAWMKNVVHVIGGKDNSENDLFKYYMDGYKRIIEDTLYGAKVETFSKSSTAAVQLIASQRLEELFKEGISMISYFGHSSANTLEFNLSSPETYQNQGKYPFFNVSGCTAGDNYIYSQSRVSGDMSISEKYVLANQRGTIAFLASTHLGIPPYLNNYNTELYKQISALNYGNSAGNDIKNVIEKLGGGSFNIDYLTRIHLEENNLHGDPAIKIYPHPKPDYIIEEPMIKINPSIVSVADNSFSINIEMLNIGKAINDSIRVSVKRQLPNDTVVVIYDKLIPAIKYADSLNFTITINPVTDKGLNKITVSIDVDNTVDEISEVNNTVTKEFFIFEDEARPVYPYNFSIVNTQNITYYSSTANPLTAQREILFEVDTTELFNSALKKSLNVTSVGGVIQFNPSITYIDSTVYYWRVGITPQSGPVIWNNASFVFLANSSDGFNQSHYYQFAKSTYNFIRLNPDRRLSFTPQPHTLQVDGTTYPTGGSADTDFLLIVDGDNAFWKAACGYGIIFNVFDTINFKPLYNNNSGQPGRYGSYTVCSPTRPYNFEFDYNTVAGRKKAMNFMDSIPKGYYVVVRMIESPNQAANKYASDWKADQSIYGDGISLYHKLFNAGLNNIDSFYRPRTFNFIYKKNDQNFSPVSTFSTGIYDRISNALTLYATGSSGTIESPLFGPAKTWKELHWRGRDIEPNAPDDVAIEVYGINSSGAAVKLATVKNATDTTLSFINAASFRYLKLKMLNTDSLHGTAHQLDYWRVNADYVPEGAVAPNIFYKMKDTVEVGENIEFALAFKNISKTAFDSLKIKFIITDKNNVAHPILFPRMKPLQSGDTLIVNYTIDSKEYAGINTLFVEFNPDNDQPEQVHFNNFIYKNFLVRGDNFNPLLDVTFDGVHILNRDIVSARPHIVIKLKDESKFLALNDTSLINVQIQYPDGSLKTFRFDNDTMKFTPATLGSGENTATIDLSPDLPGNDDEYELVVSGKDKSGNKAGELEYRVSFRIISKPMISNLLNYPNPFTTSTAFVFTVTGSQVPQNIRIQILTITGKIVREITKDELGLIHIGRNITEFKWDGTDMYGSRLANGVYLYRVLTNLNGKTLEKYKAEGDNTDKYFTKGYGKMYLLK